MTRVLFNETRTTKEADPVTFEAGRVYDLPPRSAARWIARGVAVPADDQGGQLAPAEVDGLAEEGVAGATGWPGDAGVSPEQRAATALLAEADDLDHRALRSRAAEILDGPTPNKRTDILAALTALADAAPETVA